MRAAAKALGIVGGILGIIVGIIVVALGAQGYVLGAGIGGTVAALGVAAIIVAVIGLVGGALAERPTASWILMTLSGVAGFIFITVFWALPGVLLIVGACLEFASRHQKRVAPLPAGYMGTAAPYQAAPYQTVGPGYPMPPIAPPMSPAPSTVDALVKLAELRQQDLLIEEEYERERARLAPHVQAPAPASPHQEPAVVPPVATPTSTLSSAAHAASATDRVDALVKLAELRQEGLVTEEEFEREKAELLAKP